MKKLLFALLLVPVLAYAAGGELKLDRAPDRVGNNAALQHGAKLFVTYCLSCHSASFMRFNRLRDIGLSDKQIEANLMYTTDKVGNQMTIAMRRDDAKKWFGVPPPDLSLEARARASEAGSGADWLYTYLRSFYRDDSRPTGWNNTVFPNVAMPNVLWQLQGEQVLGADGKLTLEKPGQLSAAKYDADIADLVGYLQYMGEPAAQTRERVGVYVLIFLAAFFVLAYALKREFWKDIH